MNYSLAVLPSSFPLSLFPSLLPFFRIMFSRKGVVPSSDLLKEACSKLVEGVFQFTYVFGNSGVVMVRLTLRWIFRDDQLSVCCVSLSCILG